MSHLEAKINYLDVFVFTLGEFLIAYRILTHFLFQLFEDPRLSFGVYHFCWESMLSLSAFILKDFLSATFKILSLVFSNWSWCAQMQCSLYLSCLGFVILDSMACYLSSNSWQLPLLTTAFDYIFSSPSGTPVMYLWNFFHCAPHFTLFGFFFFFGPFVSLHFH